MKHSLETLLLLPSLACLVVAPLHAGVVYEIETKDHSDQGSTYQSQVSAEGENLKMNIHSSRSKDGEMIFRGDRREMVVVDHDNHSYMVIDQETIEQIGAQIGSIGKQMEDALKNVPESQRAAIEEMMKKQMPQAQTAKDPKSEVRKTGEKATHNGFPCTKYEVMQGGRVIRELWVTSWNQIEGGDEIAESMREMSEFFQSMMDSLSSGGGFPGGGFNSDSMFEHMSEIDGFPVVTREIGDDGTLTSESHLRNAERRTLSPGDFEPPAGYKRQAMFGGR